MTATTVARHASTPTRVPTVFLALIVALTTGMLVTACSRRLPDRPADAAGKPLAVDDPDRYLPPRLSDLRVGKLPPTLNDDVATRAQIYGLDEWVRAYQGATLVAGAGDLARGFLSVVQRGDPDPELESRVAFFGSGSGEITDPTEQQVGGERVRTGTVKNADGTFPFAVWSPEDTEVTVAITARAEEDQSGLDPVMAMRELIDWSTR